MGGLKTNPTIGFRNKFHQYMDFVFVHDASHLLALLLSNESLGDRGQAGYLHWFSSLSQSLFCFWAHGITKAEGFLKANSKIHPPRITMNPKYLCFSEICL